MLLLKPQHLPSLAIAQRSLIFLHLPSNLRIGTSLLQVLHRRYLQRTPRIRSIENLKPRRALQDAEITDLPEISRIDIAPRVSLPRLRLVDVRGEIRLILMRLDHVPDAQRVDVRAREASREPARAPLPAQLAGRVGVHRVAVVVLLEGKLVVVCVALRETDAVRGFAARNDDLLDAQLAGRFDDVVGA